jgi:hypothetical protein
LVRHSQASKPGASTSSKLLAEKLKDPAFRKTEGFPQGTDEAILAMSDPPYYTACPNPFLEEFVRHYGKPYDPSVKYSREPQTIDVSVGKTDPLYKAHSYHTKVPHLAIVPSILHYTEPGDIVLDGFWRLWHDRRCGAVVRSAPAAYRHELETEWKKQGKGRAQVGLTASHPQRPVACGYVHRRQLQLAIRRGGFCQGGQELLLEEVEHDLGWMYETTHIDGKTKGRVEFTVWSEVFTCPHCAGEVNFVDEALDEDSKRVRDFSMPTLRCGPEQGQPRSRS